ncbi:VirB3 family type IV secretion system protein [Escherichia coli]
MSTLYKAMTRPAMYVGVPVVPLRAPFGKRKILYVKAVFCTD